MHNGTARKGTASNGATRNGAVVRAAPVAVLAALLAAIGGAACVGGSPARRDVDTPLRVRLLQPVLPDAAFAAARALPGIRAALVRADVAASVAPRGGEVRSGAGPRSIDPPPAPGDRGTAADGRPTLTFWPEGAVPGPVPWAPVPGAPDPLEELLRPLGPALVGAPFRTGSTIANSVLAWDGALRHAYDKQRLVPFAEARLRAGVATSVVDLGGTRVAPLVCFEAAFPGSGRAAARRGAELLAVVTNDDFAAFSDVPELHLRVAAFRAVETGLPLVFASNDGPSAVARPDGGLAGRSPARKPAVLEAEVAPGRGGTAYVLAGDWVGLAASVAAIVALAAAVGWKGGDAPPTVRRVRPS